MKCCCTYLVSFITIAYGLNWPTEEEHLAYPRSKSLCLLTSMQLRVYTAAW